MILRPGCAHEPHVGDRRRSDGEAKAADGIKLKRDSSPPVCQSQPIPGEVQVEDAASRRQSGQ